MFALSISDVRVCVLCVCVSLSLSLSLSLVNTGLCRYSGARKLTLAAFIITSFLGARGRDSRIHIIEQQRAKTVKKISLRAHSSRNQKISRDFFFLSNSDKTSILVVVKTCLSHLVLILFFAFLFLYTHARQKEKHTKKRERDARAVRNRHGRRGRDDVRAKHPPGVPERFKGSRLMIEIVFSFFGCERKAPPPRGTEKFCFVLKIQF